MADPIRVAVFMDWQNVYNAARRAFGWDRNWPNEYGTFSPYRLATILAAGNNRGAEGAVLERVEVHRGLPSSTRDPKGHGANRRQAAAWAQESPLVRACHRPLRYPRDWPARPPGEKGVDVALALAVVEALTLKQCDVAILFSHDTDLIPAVEVAARFRGARSIETASWSSPIHRSRLRPDAVRVYHHEMSRQVFDLVADQTNYASP